MCWLVSMTLHDIAANKPRQQADRCNNSAPLPYNMWANGDPWLCSESMWFGVLFYELESQWSSAVESFSEV